MTARFLAAAFALLASPLLAQVDLGDRHWDRRAEGAQGGRARAELIDASIGAYQRAIAQNPGDVEARAKLLRAYRFKGAYVAKTNDEKKRVYGTAKTAGAEAIAVVEKALAARGVRSPAKAAPEDLAPTVRAIPGAAAVYLWDAVNWGEWALAYGKMAAAREGAADRIRRGATIARLADPTAEDAAASRVLGRLHDQTPRIPFITGWASSKEAVRFLNESLKAAPANKITIVFLAEALVSHDSSSKQRAVQLLRNAIAAPNDPKYAVEDAAAVEDARALLARISR